jgi:hypothetical protein
MEAGYKLIDEPAPSALSRLAVNPVWIFLASLFGGAGLGLLWFAVNAFALGSTNKRRELAYVVVGLCGTPLTFWILGTALARGLLDESWVPYLRLLVTGFQLLIVYLLQLSQQKSYELYTLFGGTGRNAILVVVALAFLRPRLAEALGIWSVLFL